MTNEERQAATVAASKTEVQREAMAALVKRGITVYGGTATGKGIVHEFRRYCETTDAGKIRGALYDFSMSGSGLGSIAHFGLGGFRDVYRHPALYISELLDRARPVFHSQYVYTDGMTSSDVLGEIRRIADVHRARLFEDYRRRENEAKLKEASRLADELGLKLVPKTIGELLAVRGDDDA